MAVPITLVFLLTIYPTVHSKSPFRRKRCLNKDIKNIIIDVVNEVATSPDFNSSCETPGVIANVIQSIFFFKFLYLDSKTTSRIEIFSGV